MLPRLALLAIALPTMALAADQPPPSGRFTAPVPQSTAVAAPAPTPPVTAPAAAGPEAVAAPIDPAECRIGCANAFYACSAGERAETCPPSWSQCVAECASPDLAPAFSTAP